MKALYPWLTFGLLLAVTLFCVKAYGDAREREGIGIAVNARQETDLAHLVSWASQQQVINQQVLDGVNGLNAFQDSDVGPATKFSLERVRALRKPQGTNPATTHP